MRAMILAAGRGERMRPLTDTCPKPLLQAGGKMLIERHLERLANAGFTDIVINTAWLGEMIEARLGAGERWNLRLHYSHEARALETAGGIAHALPLLGQDTFLLINGDVHIEWDPAQARALAAPLQAGEADMWLMLVDNPEHHPGGDFVLDDRHRLQPRGPGALTYAGVALYHPRLFAGVDPDAPAPMLPLMQQAIAQGRALGQHFSGRWADIGTVQRLAALDAALRQT